MTGILTTSGRQRALALLAKGPDGCTEAALAHVPRSPSRRGVPPTSVMNSRRRVLVLKPGRRH